VDVIAGVTADVVDEPVLVRNVDGSERVGGVVEAYRPRDTSGGSASGTASDSTG
jgi:hypothetical protein